MGLYKMRSNPTEKGQASYGIGIPPTQNIPIPDAMGNVWNFTKHVANP